MDWEMQYMVHEEDVRKAPKGYWYVGGQHCIVLGSGERVSSLVLTNFYVQ